MSIFPKRTVPGKGVTIHWNFQGPIEGSMILFPKVRIRVRDPLGAVHDILNGHIAALPSVPPSPTPARAPIFPEPSTPLLVLAGLLEGRHKRERLHDLLQGIRDGRHYYFHFPISGSAPLGKYVLESEVIVEGDKRLSATAEEDFFFVEKPELEALEPPSTGSRAARIRNASEEAVPVSLLHYSPACEIAATRHLLAAKQITVLALPTARAYLLYSEGREWIDLSASPSPICVRNQDFLWLPKMKDGRPTLALIHRESQAAYELEGKHAEIWQASEGLCCRDEIVPADGEAAYAELLAEGLILEIEWPGYRGEVP